MVGILVASLWRGCACRIVTQSNPNNDKLRNNFICPSLSQTLRSATQSVPSCDRWERRRPACCIDQRNEAKQAGRLRSQIPQDGTDSWPLTITPIKNRQSKIKNAHGFHSGTRPGVHGAPPASNCFSSFERSTSINCF